jgi:hypothetical protein
MDGADLGVRIRGEERVEVVGGLAFLDLPDRCPVGPDAGEAGEGSELVEREPDVAACFFGRPARLSVATSTKVNWLPNDWPMRRPYVAVLRS